MALKDHAFFFVVAACCATAAVTWAVSEQLRVAPVQAQLQTQMREGRSSPAISRVTLTEELRDGATLVKQRFSYRDPEGDAKFLSLVVVQTNAATLSVSSSSLRATPAQQRAGATEVSTWTCVAGLGSYYVTLRAIVTDAAGNASLPKDYTVTCGN